MKRRPLETTGEEWVSEPRGIFQRMPVLEGKSILAGRLVSGEAMLRDHADPHCGWSPAAAGSDSSRGSRKRLM